ncbi:purine-binding chemotaxis protein CheW [Clostridium fermenticellae]|uniref:Purine-binding chemotaxis protein CheW n=1 Tax=Clostridium fermenticellae TaxID=2068654 RepID=A0A386H4Z1_9CLOT|nr:chemotaxis protein CheW [Clostridium fermenticellae]AYD40730.1 purine-binding chemotaxis protein CheW [Clostridium fermenticellae]
MGNNDLKVLIFSIDNQYYATDIMEVERILEYEEPTKLPDSPDFVDGVINYQGNIISVMSLDKRFNLQNSLNSREAKIIVVKQNEDKIGIIVDLVSEVKNVSANNIENPPDIVAGISKRYLKGLIKLENRIIILLNLSTILTEEEKELI